MSTKMSKSSENNSYSSGSPPTSVFCSLGSETSTLSDTEIKRSLHAFLDSMGAREDVLILPPDFTRFHSQAGKITRFICEYYKFVESEKEFVVDDEEPSVKKQKIQCECSNTSEFSPTVTILPALGTHVPMTKMQIKSMFGTQLSSKEPDPFLIHDWRKDVVTIGHVPSQMVSDATYGKVVNRPWPAQLNKIVWEKRKVESGKRKTLVLSVGQVVPHEVMGMANFNKNLFVGVGGVEAINLSHFIGAVHGMEKMMGRASNPLREILNYASVQFLQNELDLWYILTVMGTTPSGEVEMRGFYIGNDINCYNLACDLSLKVNFTMLDRAPKKVIVHLDEEEFHSTWLGNKAIYRTRMAIANGGELIILAPGVKQFGEDNEIDKLIRAHGYVGTPKILDAMTKDPKLQENLSAVAHLIHGSSEGRFSITYCPGHLTKEEIESVGFQYGNLKELLPKYDVTKLRNGWNILIDPTSGLEEEFFYITNPALGLWAVPSRFEDSTENNPKSCSNLTLDEINYQVHSDGSGGVGGWKIPPSS